jgi:hypothetical protein
MAEGDGAATDTGIPAMGQPVQTTAPTPPPAPPPTTITLTQDDLDSKMGQRAEQAKRTERKALLESLGFSSLKDAEDLVKAHREAQDAQRTDTERAIARAEEARLTAERERESLTAERHTLNVERALMAAGAQGDLARLARLVDVETGAELVDISAAVEAAKTEFPSLFGTATAAPAPSEPTGGGAPSRPSSSPDALARGQARAEQYNTQGGRIPS